MGCRRAVWLQLLALLSFGGLTSATANALDRSQSVGGYCCTLLSFALGSNVSFPSTAAYKSSINSYRSGQEKDVAPRCIFSPASTQDVSKVVALLTGSSSFGSDSGSCCQFAIKSGGQTPWAGAANIGPGVTIDLSAINQVTVSSDQSYTSVGPGNRWIDVYMKLDEMGLAVLGGRVASVGVGGLVIGGGFSFFSPRYGFVCDSVINFEVVLADGQIVEANAESNPDLWYALKGGSNNFGIVTRIDLKTFPQGKFWGGMIGYTIDTAPQQIQALVDFANQPNYDIYATLINSFIFSAATGWFVINNYEYTKPLAYPQVFNEYTAIEPQIFNTMRISNLSDFAMEIDGPYPDGQRQIFYTATYAPDYSMLYQLFQLSNSSLQAVVNVVGISWSLVLQPIVPEMTKFGAQTGGNALGLDPSEGSLVVALLSITWFNPGDDAAVIAAAHDLFDRANAYAAAHGKLNKFLYLNYSYKDQRPISGYGAANVAKLKSISRKHDPEQIFQNLVPGGFKLATS